MAGQGGTDGGMAVQVDIGLASAGHLGPGRLVAGVQRLALLDAARFLARHIALMDGHLAIGAHIDIDAPALALGGLPLFPFRKMLAGRDTPRTGTSRPPTANPPLPPPRH